MSQPHILIKNGLIIDGTGNDPFAGDVLVHEKRIVAVGQEARASCPDGAVVEEIDASGCRVLPGMIDSHCHISFDQPNSNDDCFFIGGTALPHWSPGSTPKKYFERVSPVSSTRTACSM